MNTSRNCKRSSVLVGSAFCLAAIHSSAQSISGWGFNFSGQLLPPPGLTNVVALAASSGHSLALKSDGKVVGWGVNFHGQASVPSNLSNVVAISAGSLHSLALMSN